MAVTPYELLGETGVRALAKAFYAAMDSLPEAAPIRAMHGDDLESIERKLAAYLTGWMGGPPVWLAMRGSVCLHEAHAAYAIGPAERDQWLRCMEVALERTGASAELRSMLAEPLFRIADAIRNRGDDRPQAAPARIIARG